MIKFKIILSIFSLLLLFSCSMDLADSPAVESEKAVETVELEKAEIQAAVSTAATKTVTVKRRKSVTIHRTKIGKVFGAIKNGSERIYYNQGGYKGYIYSVGFRVYSAPTTQGEYITFPLEITYKGPVTAPSTKVVTASQSISKTIHRRNIGKVFNAIKNGSESYYYNRGGYKGLIYSVGFRITGPPKTNGEYITFPMSVNYKGTVRK